MVKTITIQDIRKNGSKSLPKDDVTYLIVNSKPMSAIVPIEQYEAMEELLEDLLDIQSIKERMHEDSISLEEAFA